MTTIVGFQGAKFAVVGVDSRITDFGDSGIATQASTMRSGTGKVAQIGKFLIGAAGDVRAINLLHYAFNPPAPPQRQGKVLDRFITTRFIPALRSLFDEHGYGTNDKQRAEQASQILVVVNACIYVVDSDYSWSTDESGLYALGSGCQFALGAMAALVGKNSDEAEVVTAVKSSLRVAATYDPHSGAPFEIFVQTKSLTSGK